MLKKCLLPVLILVITVTTTLPALAGQFVPVAPMATPRNGHTATLLPNGKVLVTGGDNGSGQIASAELYDPSTNTWSYAASLSMAHPAGSATLLPNNKVLVLSSTSAEVYDPATGAWSATASAPMGLSGRTAILLSTGKVLVLNATAPSALYDPIADTWSSLTVSTRSGASVTLLADGKVLLLIPALLK